MPQLKFERILRDCGHNDSVKAGCTNSMTGKAGRLIYDFNVLIDGEHRAILKRRVHGKGYEVADANQRPVKTDWRYGHQIGSKAEFEGQITGLLDRGLIPTVAKMAELRAAEAAEKVRKEAEGAEALRVRTIQAAGVELYEALKSFLAHMRPTNVDVRQRVEAAIAKAEGALDPSRRKSDIGSPLGAA